MEIFQKYSIKISLVKLKLSSIFQYFRVLLDSPQFGTKLQFLEHFDCFHLDQTNWEILAYETPFFGRGKGAWAKISTGVHGAEGGQIEILRGRVFGRCRVQNSELKCTKNASGLQQLLLSSSKTWNGIEQIRDGSIFFGMNNWKWWKTRLVIWRDLSSGH